VYRSDYKLQKEFENKILTSSYEELKEYVHYKGVKPQLNKGKSCYLAAKRGDVKILNLLLKNIGYRKSKISFNDLLTVCLEENNISAFMYLLDESYNIDFRFYLNRGKFIGNALCRTMNKKDFNIELARKLLIDKKHVNSYDFNVETKKYILEKIIESKDVELFNTIAEDFGFSNYLLRDEIVDFCLKENGIELLKPIISKLSSAYDISQILSRISRKGYSEILFNYKNKNNIKIKAINEIQSFLSMSLKSENYQSIKKCYNKKITTLDNKITSFRESSSIKNPKLLKKVFNIFLNDPNFDIEDNASDYLEFAVLLNNVAAMKLILDNTSSHYFFKDNIMNYAVFSDDCFNLAISDNRIPVDNDVLEAFNHCIEVKDFNKIKVLINFRKIQNKITYDFLLKLFENRNYDVLKIILKYKKYEEFKNISNIKTEFLTFWKVNKF
jgi:hypothetical protein